MLPDWLSRFLGSDPRLLEICPKSESQGVCVEAIRSLTHFDLVNGAKVHSSTHLELVRGGLFYAVDALGPAHAIFQENHTALGSYWHGMMHRREGDFGNACYWFRKAGALPVLREIPGFDPVAFTMACERVTGDLPEHLALQKQEWETLMLHCLSKALGGEPLQA